MSLYERNGIWWIYLVAPNGKKIRRSTELNDKIEAQKKHDLLKTQLIKAPQSVLTGNQTWQEASSRWLDECKHKATWDKDKMVLRWFGEQIPDAPPRFALTGYAWRSHVKADNLSEAMPGYSP